MKNLGLILVELFFFPRPGYGDKLYHVEEPLLRRLED